MAPGQEPGPRRRTWVDQPASAPAPRRRLSRPMAVLAGLAALVVVCAGGVAATALMREPAAPTPQAAAQGPSEIDALPAPVITSTPIDTPEKTSPTTAPPSDGAAPTCDDEQIATAVSAGDSNAVIDALGGAEALQEAVRSGDPCIPIDDPRLLWAVVNKQRPLNPIDYAPSPIVRTGLQSFNDAHLREDIVPAVVDLAQGMSDAGAGNMAVLSGYRSYNTQVATFGRIVGAQGQESAEAVSARPGFSEHQTGLAFDVIACTAGRCGTMEQFGSSPQGAWTAENAWRYGFIVRYEAGYTSTSGYSPEPWHLRYVGVPIATAYHEGGYHTLEDFFGLDAAPDYLD